MLTPLRLRISMHCMPSKPALSPGATLAKVLEKRDMSQGDLARMINVNRCLVSRWLSDFARPSVANALRLRDHLGLPIETWAPEARVSP